MAAISMLFFVFIALIPMLLLAWLITSIVIFAKTPKGAPQKSFWRGMLIASSVTTGVLFVSGLLLLAITLTEISFM
ncbi:MAG: hypothetical protein IKU30_02385 [Clostridia bacterium]|nr:hypothetical protein [Clostridia bacterium]